MNTEKAALDRAFLMIRNAPELAPFRQWLLDEQDKTGEALIGADDSERFRVAQGAARFIKSLNKAIEDAGKRP